MRLRIVSDIHIDINKSRNYQFDFGDDFIVACGDISGDRFATEDWVNANIRKGVFVEGNHLGYNRVTFDEDDTKEHSIKYLKRKFKKGSIRFLENDLYIVDDIVFVGCTLYSDFSLYDKPVYCSRLASKSMNDFIYVKVKDKDSVRSLYTNFLRLGLDILKISLPVTFFNFKVLASELLKLSANLKLVFLMILFFKDSVYFSL